MSHLRGVWGVVYSRGDTGVVQGVMQVVVQWQKPLRHRRFLQHRHAALRETRIFIDVR